MAARRAAEALGAKFSDVATGSISPGGQAQRLAAQAPEPTMPLPFDPPHAGTPNDEARTILLSSKHTDDPKLAKRSTKTASRSKPKDMRRKTSAYALHGPAVRSTNAQVNGEATLATIGQKVSFVELLTNPALWHWPSLMSNTNTAKTTDQTNDTYANR
jgi:hypothetical protein